MNMKKQSGFSLIELLIVVAIILIIAAIAIPNLLRARMAANDSSAASAVRAVTIAETAYVSTYPLSGFSVNLQNLGPNGLVCATSTPTATSACLIDDQLGCAATKCLKAGYNFMMTSTTATAPVPDYTLSASPLRTNITGSRNLCTNPDAVIRQSPVGTAEFTTPETLVNCADLTKYTAMNE